MPGHYGMMKPKKTTKKPAKAIMVVGKTSKAVKLPGMPKKAKPKMM